AVALATIARGAAVVATEVFEPGEALRLLEAERCTVFFGWPHQAEALIQHPRFASAKLALHKGVGANVPWAARLYPPDHQAVATWGMTETGPMFTAWPATAPLELRASGHGAPIAGREVRICDPERGVPVVAGAAGEICVRGPTLFSHYDGFSPEDCFDADGFFHTGDLGRLDERGTLHFLGRIKDVIKTAGANVAAAEVEAALLRHPAARAAHVVPGPSVRRTSSRCRRARVARTWLRSSSQRGPWSPLRSSSTVGPSSRATRSRAISGCDARRSYRFAAAARSTRPCYAWKRRGSPE